MPEITPPFYSDPILNSPYEEPTLHHALTDDGLPLNEEPRAGRRPSKYIVAVPKARKKKSSTADQGDLVFSDADGISSAEQEYNPTPIINEIREKVAVWRRLPNPNDWGVTPATAKLLQHWRSHDFQGVRPFFCQVEAVETIIWLTEVARQRRSHPNAGNKNSERRIWDHIEEANLQANPALLRLALKMATGAGKTTVMAMLIAWQTANAVRSPTSSLFTRGFLLIAPGITIRDRLRVLLPSDTENYYKDRELVPADMLNDIGKAKIVITNYHAFQLKEQMEVNKVGKSLLRGRGEEIQSKETEGQMVRRVADELMGLKNIVVINDEAHHCYRDRRDNELYELKGDEKKEATKENDAARLWINGIEAFKRKLGVRAVYDLSATPFFLRGSGYVEGTLFPWVVSDFSLIDAIECGIVKLPRVPVADNIPDAEVPVFRDLWPHISKQLPKKGRGQTDLDPEELPAQLQTALVALYNHYEKTADEWKRAGIEVPPVFIVVCNNTSTSKLVAEWISGWQRPLPDDPEEMQTVHFGHLKQFTNFDEHGNPLPRPNTLLVDSAQLESGEALDKNFRLAAAREIEQFKREIAQREGAASANEISDEAILREVMNTVGRKGKLGEQIRCVVSVSMLTEGWDTNTVTHILGVRAFGTQLLCEQVVGRGLRRYSYQLNAADRFDVEYADILGIPFNFTAKPVVSPPTAPKRMQRIHAVKEQANFEILFPRVVGYRVQLPEERLNATFTEESRLVLDPSMVGPGETIVEGIVGEGHKLTVAEIKDMRPSTISFELAKHLLYNYFKDGDGEPKLPLFGQLKRIVRRWIDEGYLVCKGGTGPWMLGILQIANMASERLYNAIASAVGDRENITAVLDAYNPKGSTRHVGFMTSKNIYEVRDKSHVNAVVCDSEWEAVMAMTLESHPKVISFVKNQGLGFEVPYVHGGIPHKYIPDFIVQVDDGRGEDDPLNLIIEVKGRRDETVKSKHDTIRTKWVRGVNALKDYGRWHFEEFGDVWEISDHFDAVMKERLADIIARATGEKETA